MRVLAGPIVRRVEPRLAAIWVAVDVECNVRLDIWRGIQNASFIGTPQFRATAQTVRAGDQLHIGLVVADLKDEPEPLLPEVLYSYNLTFNPTGGGQATLQSLN